MTIQPVRIGKSESGPVELDLVKLIDSRALIQANSGGGKSYLLRLIAEQAGSQNQIVIIDPEGEFASLRERLDLILVGQAGEIPANPRTAAPLARRLVESGASAVLDIYDLEKQHQRPAFVRNFLEALMAVPKTLYKPILIPIDEAQDFCPQDGSCQSASAIISLMAQGRKRGFCGLLATQRLSKLHKDAAAECNNVFIGRTWLDTDQKRAADMLGMGKEQRIALRDMGQGEWLTFGPAINLPGVTRFKADQCKTTHPKAGERHKLKPPPPSASVKGLVHEMADLSNRDPDEALTLDEAQQIIARLKKDSRAKIADLQTAPDQGALDRARAAGAADKDRQLRPLIAERDRIIRELSGRMGKAATKLADVSNLLHVNGDSKLAQIPDPVSKVGQSLQKHRENPRATVAQFQPQKPESVPRHQSEGGDLPSDSGLTPRQQRFLDAAASLTTLGAEVTRETVSAWVGVHPRGGSVGEELKALAHGGFIELDRGRIKVTRDGHNAAGDIDPEQAIERAKSGLTARQARFFEVICRVYPNEVSREEIAAEFELHPRGGSLGEDLGRLASRGLVEANRGRYRAREFLFAGT